MLQDSYQSVLEARTRDEFRRAIVKFAQNLGSTRCRRSRCSTICWATRIPPPVNNTPKLEGKTAWQLGKILSISEGTAVFHVNSAMHKLRCITKHQAALKAQRMGFLR